MSVVSSLDAPVYTRNLFLMMNELNRTLGAVSQAETEEAQHLLFEASRIFVTGAGRSGLALRMAAMRLMHLGLKVHVAGEVTTPAIGAGDVLLVASGSGTTAGAVHAAEVARRAGAKILAITTAPESPLAGLSAARILIPAQTKQNHAGTVSMQYAGSLFEQSVLLVMDAIFQAMWHERGESAEELWKRHANLE
jgi:6-phospho-3-hexuloisomerase